MDVMPRGRVTFGAATAPRDSYEPASVPSASSDVVETAAGRKPHAIIQSASTISYTRHRGHPQLPVRAGDPCWTGGATRPSVTPKPPGRRRPSPRPTGLYLVGDLVDRGPDTPGVLRLVMGMVADGRALCVPGLPAAAGRLLSRSGCSGLS